MPESSAENRLPKVSIILPTYNRAAFLPQAFEAIKGQLFQDWELIIVDDGSTDNTRPLVADLEESIPQAVRYHFQTNAGAYAARNTGLDLANGEYIAFYDSDDCWFPHHLQDCINALDHNADVDWVYGSGRIVNFATGEELVPNSFYDKGNPRPFLSLRTRAVGKLMIIDDEDAVRCMIQHGLYCGLQKSVIRRKVFSNLRFSAAKRNEVEDQVFAVVALTNGCRLAYFDKVHQTYHVHGANSTSPMGAGSLEKKLNVFRLSVQGFEELETRVRLKPPELRALRHRISQEYFWILGYALLWQNGSRREALEMFRRGLQLAPCNLGFWKTYLLALVRDRVWAVGERVRRTFKQFGCVK